MLSQQLKLRPFTPELKLRFSGTHFYRYSEYRTAMKKREALNSLFNSGKISKSTFELFDREFEEALAEVERQRRFLLEKMAAKIGRLKSRSKFLNGCWLTMKSSMSVGRWTMKPTGERLPCFP
jgi:recombinational DNA repair ATPase RecF